MLCAWTNFDNNFVQQTTNVHEDNFLKDFPRKFQFIVNFDVKIPGTILWSLWQLFSSFQKKSNSFLKSFNFYWHLGHIKKSFKKVFGFWKFIEKSDMKIPDKSFARKDKMTTA